MKALPKQHNNQWKSYKNACIGISLSSQNHTGSAFAGILRWVGQNFETCILDLSDTLYRYNMTTETLPLRQARQKARMHGSLWLNKHQAMIDELPIKKRLIRWDHWLSHIDFEKNFMAFRSAYETQPDFRDCILRDAHGFYQRQGTTPTPEALIYSINYLLEELAAHSILYAENPSAVIYPGREHESSRMARAGLVKNVPDGLQNSHFTRMVIYNFDRPESSGYENFKKTILPVEKIPGAANLNKSDLFIDDKFANPL